MKVKQVFVVLFVFALFFAVPTKAQEPDATEETGRVEVGADDNEVTIETPSTTVVETQSNLNWLLVWVGAVSTLLLGGFGLAIFSRLNNNVPLKDSTEAILGNSVPASTLESAHKLSEALLAQTDNAMGVIKNLLEFARDVTDQKPNTQPPAQG